MRLRVTTSAALRRLRSTLMGLRGPPRTPAHRSRMDIGSTRPVRRSTPCGCSINAPPPSRSCGWPSLDFRSPSEFITGTPCRPAGYPAGRTTLPLLTFLYPTTQYQTSSYALRPWIPPRPRATSGVWIPPSRHSLPALPMLSHRSAHGLNPSRTSPRYDRHPSRVPYPPVVTRCFMLPRREALTNRPASGP